MSKDKNKVLSFTAYRRKKQKEQEQNTDPQDKTPQGNTSESSPATHKAPAASGSGAYNDESGDTSSGAPKYEQAHLALKKAMSQPLIVAEELPTFMQRMLQGLNEDMALAKQRYPDAKSRRFSHIYVPLTPKALPKDILNIVREDFASALENKDPYRHERIRRRAARAIEKNPGENKHYIVKDEFNKAVIATTPVYNNLAGHLRKVFPEGILSPQMTKVAENTYLPCLRLELPSHDDRDIRDVIKSYLNRKPGQPDLRLV